MTINNLDHILNLIIKIMRLKDEIVDQLRREVNSLR